MSKILILSVIVSVSVSAQFVSERRSAAGRGGSGAEREDLDASREVETVGSRASSRHDRRTPEHRQVGGFQNGNFAPTDGRLRTNLDSAPTVSDYDRNFEIKVETTYIVEEGAAFRRPEHAQFDVHSSQGRDAYLDTSYLHDSNQRKQSQDLETQRHGEGIELSNQNINGDTDSKLRGRNIDEHSTSRNGNNNQNTQERNRNRDSNNDRVTNFDQTTNQRGQGIGDSEQKYTENNNQNKFNMQNTQETNNKEKNSHSVTQHDTRNNNQNTRVTTGDRKRNSEANSNSNKPVANFDNKPRADQTNNDNLQSYDREAADRALNNQISKMIFSESTQEVTTRSNTKTTKDNELGLSKGGSERQDDRWIWHDGSEVSNVTTTVVPTVDDRAAFAGDQCPTGQVRFNNVCVDED